MSGIDHDDWITVKEAANLAERTERTIYAWVEEQRLAVLRGRRNRMLVLRKAVIRLSNEIRPGRPRDTRQ